MTIDAPALLFDGMFDEAATYNGSPVRVIVEERAEPALDGGINRAKPGLWADIRVMAASLPVSTPEVHDQIVITSGGTTWDVEKYQREGSVWLLLCLTSQRGKR